MLQFIWIGCLLVGLGTDYLLCSLPQVETRVFFHAVCLSVYLCVCLYECLPVWPSSVLNTYVLWYNLFFRYFTISITPVFRSLSKCNSRSFVLFLKDGKLIFERYGDGCHAETPMLGWSSTKSLVNALFGRLVSAGLVSLDTGVDLQEWVGGGTSSAQRRPTLR